MRARAAGTVFATLAILLALFPVMTPAAAQTDPAAGTGCFAWAGQVPLHQAVKDHECVQMSAGTWVLDRFLILPAGHTLQGDPSVPRAAIRLEAGQGWVNTQGDGVVNDDGFGGEVATVRHFLIDGNNIATGGIGARRIHIEDMAIEEGSCWGVAIAGEGVTVRRSWIRANGQDPSCFGPPGAGIYGVTQQPGGAPGYYAPSVTDNFIRGNNGPGIEVAAVWFGELRGNVIEHNSSWAGVSIFGSNWSITDNQVIHPATSEGQPYLPACRGGPNGTHSAAIFLCQIGDANNDITVKNEIARNRVIGWYGILLIGRDQVVPYWAPRNNRIEHNSAFGSRHGYVDDFRPGQWFGERNHWVGNTPTYF